MPQANPVRRRSGDRSLRFGFAPGAHRNGKREFNLARGHGSTFVIEKSTVVGNNSMRGFSQPGKQSPVTDAQGECGQGAREVNVVTGRWALHQASSPDTNHLLPFFHHFLAPIQTGARFKLCSPGVHQRSASPHTFHGSFQMDVHHLGAAAAFQSLWQWRPLGAWFGCAAYAKDLTYRRN